MIAIHRFLGGSFVLALAMLAVSQQASAATLNAYWSFDNPSNLGEDSTANNNDGTVFGGVTAVGGAADFNGSSGYISVPDSPTVSPGQITISYWMNPDNAGGATVHKWSLPPSQPQGDRAYAVDYPGAINWVTNPTGTTTDQLLTAGGNTLTLGAWLHVTTTYDSSTGQMKIYYNGVDRGTRATPGGNLENSANITALGRRTDPSGFYNGRLDEVRIYDGPLTAAEVRTLYNQDAATHERTKTTGPLADAMLVYDMADIRDNGTGAFTDSAVNGSMVFNSTLNTSGITAANSNGRALNEGATPPSFVEAVNPAELQHGGSYAALTMFARVRMGSFSGVDDIWRFGNSATTAQDFFALEFNSGTPRFVTMQDGTVTETTLNFGSALSANAWYDITGVFDGTAQTMTLYVYDPVTGLIVGAPATLSTGFSSIEGNGTGNENLLLLEAPGNANGTNTGGQLELVSFWDRALGAAEVAQMSAAAAAAVPEPSSWALAVLGLAGLGVVAARRTRSWK